MKRVAFVLAGLLILAQVPGVVCAQGFGLPGLPSIGGMFGASSGGCGSDCNVGLCGPTAFYVGYGSRNTSFSAGAVNGLIGAIGEIGHEYTSSGIWLGLAQPINLSERVCFVASGWYLIPSGGTTKETYDANIVAGFASRAWSLSNNWYYVDGAVVWTPGTNSGFSVLGGLRYDFYSTNFKSPSEDINVGGLPTDAADVTARNYIPYIGAQWAYNSGSTSMLLRAVGIFTLVGDVKYNETLAAGAARLEGTGSWNNGKFLEILGEYTKKFGPGCAGVFARYDVANGNANVDVTNIVPGGVSRPFQLGLNRNQWTVGAKFTVDFSSPM